MLKKNHKITFEDIVPGSSYILESINDTVLLADESSFIDCNLKAVELYGFRDKSELIGLTPPEVSPPFQAGGLSSPKEAKKRMKAALKGTPQFFDWIHMKKGGELIDTEVSLKSIRYKEKKYIIALVRDISEKKKAERINDILFNIAKATNLSDSLVDLLSTIQKEVNTLMEARNFYVALVADKRKSLFRIPFIVDVNEVEIESADKILDLKDGFTDYVLQAGKPLLANREKIKKLFQAKTVRLIGTDTLSWLGVPLRARTGEIIGVIVIQSYSDPGAYSEIDMEVLNAISPTISSSILQKNAEQSLRDSEEKFKELFVNIPDAIYITVFGGENSGEILDANPAAELQSGYTVEELIGMNISKDLQAEWYDESLVIERESEIDTRDLSRFREKKRKKDGTLYWTEVIVTKTILNNRDIAIGVNRDITSQIMIEQALKKSEEKFRTVIEEAAEIVFITDNQGHITYLNPAAVASTGYSRDELIGKNYIDLIAVEYQYKVKFRYFRQYLKRESLTTAEYPFVTKGGDKRWYQLNVRLIIEKDKVRGFYIIARDITDRKKAEEEIFRLQSGLEEEVERKTRELKERISDLQRFHDATIQREFRIKELNDRIIELEAELNSRKGRLG